jgi:hypothetical protein
MRESTLKAMLVLLGSIVASCRLAGQPTLATGALDITGTYEIVICQGECASASRRQPNAIGYLVLESERYQLADIPEPARSYLSLYAETLVLVDAEERPNACFVLHKAPGARTYAGMTPVGLSLWARDSADSIHVPLDHSPDAGYHAALVIHGSVLRGRGRSWGVGDASVNLPPDSIYARRIGPPDRRICIRAAEREAAAVRARADSARQHP